MLAPMTNQSFPPDTTASPADWQACPLRLPLVPFVYSVSPFPPDTTASPADWQACPLRLPLVPFVSGPTRTLGRGCCAAQHLPVVSVVSSVSSFPFLAVFLGGLPFLVSHSCQSSFSRWY